jgi:hypothetical protein
MSPVRGSAPASAMPRSSSRHVQGARWEPRERRSTCRRSSGSCPVRPRRCAIVACPGARPLPLVDVLNVTHLGRGPTAAQRVALLWLSPQCTVEGCARTRVEVDHRVPYAESGHTRLGELDPLCKHHQHRKHHDGWALVFGSVISPGPRSHRTTPARRATSAAMSPRRIGQGDETCRLTAPRPPVICRTRRQNARSSPELARSSRLPDGSPAAVRPPRLSGYRERHGTERVDFHARG